MEKYNYYKEVENSVYDWIADNAEELKALKLGEDELEEYINDKCFVNDSVTGNASGSYFFNRWKAEEALCHNLDLYMDASAELGFDIDFRTFEDPEGMDVQIRCYVLGQVVSLAICEAKNENII